LIIASTISWRISAQDFIQIHSDLTSLLYCTLLYCIEGVTSFQINPVFHPCRISRSGSGLFGCG